MYGRVDEYLLDDLPDVVLEHKVDMCRLLLQVLDVVEPGYSRVRGMCFLSAFPIREKMIWITLLSYLFDRHDVIRITRTVTILG